MPPCLLCLNKTDQAESSDEEMRAPVGVPPEILARFNRMVATSAATGHGMSDLESLVIEAVAGDSGAQQLNSWAVNERQAEAMVRALESLGRVEDSIRQDLPIDFWTIDLRQASLKRLVHVSLARCGLCPMDGPCTRIAKVVVCLGEVTGDEVTEEVLDNIFSRFCIGK